MSISAKGVKSTRKKDLATQRTPFTAFKSFSFAHEATAGETTISLTGLNTPTSYAAMGFLQPSSSDLSAANLLLYKRNLRLHSTLRGVLLEYDAYTITGSLTILLNFEAEEGEIFVGVISDVAKSGLQVIDGKSLVSTGTLAAGETDYVVGQAFTLNKNPLSQVGDVLVFLDSQLLFRNANNATAAVDADGNYEEVDGGQGLSNTIRFNTVDPDNDRAVMVISNGMLAERPHASLRAEIETLAGQVDAISETLAVVAGVDRTNFQSAPNSVDLQSFGQRVLDMESNRARIDQANIWTVAQPLLGRTDGALVPANQIGQVIRASRTTPGFNVPAAGAYSDGVNIPLTAGIWRIDASYRMLRNGATLATGGGILHGVSTTSGNSAADLVSGINTCLSYYVNLTASNLDVYPISFLVLCDGTTITRIDDNTAFAAGTTLYHKIYADGYSAATPYYIGKLTATRIA